MSQPDWPALPAALTGVVTRPADSAYPHLRSSYMRQGRPGLVFLPQHDAEVAEVLLYAAQVRRETGQRIPLSVRSGGHGLGGTSTNDGGILLDLQGFAGVDLTDPGQGRFTAGAGATWGEVAPLLARHNLALTTGNYGGTGVGGLATAGGIGYFARSQGLTIDHVHRIKVATADGQVRWVDADHEPDLFWALRGGMTQVGVALEFEMDAPQIGDGGGHAGGVGAHIIVQQIQYQVRDLAEFTEHWGDWIREAPRELESFLTLQRAGGLAGERGLTMVSALNVWANEDSAAAIPALQAAETLDRVMQSHAQVAPYPALVQGGRKPHYGQQSIQLRNVLVDSANASLGEALAQTLGHEDTGLAELRSLGGAVAGVPTSATAWGNRHQEAFVSAWIQPVKMQDQDAAFAPLQQVGTGSYGAYTSDLRLSSAELAWPGETGVRLRKIAEEVDPEGLFDQGLVLRQEESSGRLSV